MRTKIGMMTPLSTRILAVAVRTSGPDARTCSILDIGAAWISGGPLDDHFSIECRAFDGATRDERTLLGNRLASRLDGDPDFPTEAEAIDQFADFAGLATGPVMLAGLRPSMVRSFLLAADRRGHAAGHRPIQLHARVLDLHSLFVASRLAVGIDVPSDGYPHGDICTWLRAPRPETTENALGIALRERTVAWHLLGITREL